MKTLGVALVGLGFGAAFAPIYTHHPDVRSLGLFDPDQALMAEVAGQLGNAKTYASFEAILADKSIDAVHLVSPIPSHAAQAIAVLEAGKHCACTVPMALSLEDLDAIVRTAQRSGKNYCVMETAVYTTHFLKARQMLHDGEIGRIQFLRGAHYQDMEHWPDYWMGLPPMYYGTHAIAPLVMLAGSPIVRVRGLGCGTMRDELHAQYGNPFPMETAQIEFKNGLKGEVTRSLFETAHGYSESFNLYGSKKSFEWQQIESELPAVFTLEGTRYDEQGRPYRGMSVSSDRVPTGNYYANLPEPIQRFTVRSDDYDETNPQLSLDRDASGGHGGSHPFLVHEYLRSVVENRRPLIDERLGANIVAAGICAHQSALNAGQVLDVPTYGL